MKNEEEFKKTEIAESELTDDEAEGAAGGGGSAGSLDDYQRAFSDQTYTTYFVCTNENCSGWGVDSVHKANENPICPFCSQPLVIHQSGMVFVKHYPRPPEGKVPPKPRRK